MKDGFFLHDESPDFFLGCITAALFSWWKTSSPPLLYGGLPFPCVKGGVHFFFFWRRVTWASPYRLRAARHSSFPPAEYNLRRVGVCPGPCSYKFCSSFSSLLRICVAFSFSVCHVARPSSLSFKTAAPFSPPPRRVSFFQDVGVVRYCSRISSRRKVRLLVHSLLCHAPFCRSWCWDSITADPSL